MQSTLTRLVSVLAIASAAAVLSNAAVQAQDAGVIRANCIAQAEKSFPDLVEIGQNRAQREAVYASCMRSHGLTP